MPAEKHAAKKIGLLALVQGLLVFVPISAMKFVPEGDWVWWLITVVLVLALVGEMVVVFRFYHGRSRAVAIGATLGFFVIGLPLIGFVGFLVSLMIGTFVFPPM